MSEEKPDDKESENLYNLVKDRFGDRLTAEELEQVKKDIKTIVDASKALQTVKLSNWDEPFLFFKPYKRRK